MGKKTSKNPGLIKLSLEWWPPHLHLLTQDRPCTWVTCSVEKGGSENQNQQLSVTGPGERRWWDTEEVALLTTSTVLCPCHGHYKLIWHLCAVTVLSDCCTCPHKGSMTFALTQDLAQCRASVTWMSPWTLLRDPPLEMQCNCAACPAYEKPTFTQMASRDMLLG